MAALVFDLHDTLVLLEARYSRAYLTCSLFFFQIFGDTIPNAGVIFGRLLDIDHALQEKWGVKCGRITQAMLDSYDEVSACAAETSEFRFSPAEKKKHREEIGKIGNIPFENYDTLKWLPGVEKTLTQLKKDGHKLCLLTSYDKKKWPEQKKFLGLERFFEQEHIRRIDGRKTPEDFIAVSGWSRQAEDDESEYWHAVGNGESDIRPALKISNQWRGLYIPRGSTSGYFSEKKKPNEETLGKKPDNGYSEPICHYMPPRFEQPADDQRVETLKKFSEILDVMKRLYEI